MQNMHAEGAEVAQKTQKKPKIKVTESASKKVGGRFSFLSSYFFISVFFISVFFSASSA
jgi:hypothetical protein